jgi:hypothetical protein
MHLPRVRFTVQRMMIAVTVLSIPLAIWCWRISAGFAFPSAFDFVPLAITIVSTGILVHVLGGGSGLGGRVLGPIGWRLILLNALVSVWFTSVQWEWVEETCASCLYRRTVYEKRFFSVTPQRTVRQEYPKLIGLVAADLGVPCPHVRMGRLRMRRWLGGCVCAEYNDGMFLAGEPWYPECARNTVRSWPVNDPSLVRAFRDGILHGKDYRDLRELVGRMFDACPDDQTPIGFKKKVVTADAGLHEENP